MKTDALFPDAPAMLVEGDRRYLLVQWDEADVVREALSKRGCPTTLCLNPETRQARLELWPEVTTEAALAVLEAGGPGGRGPSAASGPVAVRDRVRNPAPVAPEPADVICI
jgi:hypothetical protein